MSIVFNMHYLISYLWQHCIVLCLSAIILFKGKKTLHNLFIVMDHGIYKNIGQTTGHLLFLQDWMHNIAVSLFYSFFYCYINRFPCKKFPLHHNSRFILVLCFGGTSSNPNSLCQTLVSTGINSCVINLFPKERI